MYISDRLQGELTVTATNENNHDNTTIAATFTVKGSGSGMTITTAVRIIKTSLYMHYMNYSSMSHSSPLSVQVEFMGYKIDENLPIDTYLAEDDDDTAKEMIDVYEEMREMHEQESKPRPDYISSAIDWLAVLAVIVDVYDDISVDIAVLEGMAHLNVWEKEPPQDMNMLFSAEIVNGNIDRAAEWAIKELVFDHEIELGDIVLAVDKIAMEKGQ